MKLIKLLPVQIFSITQNIRNQNMKFLMSSSDLPVFFMITKPLQIISKLHILKNQLTFEFFSMFGIVSFIYHQNRLLPCSPQLLPIKWMKRNSLKNMRYLVLVLSDRGTNFAAMAALSFIFNLHCQYSNDRTETRLTKFSSQKGTI